jgi:hypothetical protein
VNNGSGVTTSASTCFFIRLAKTVSISASVLAARTSIGCPIVAPAARASQFEPWSGGGRRRRPYFSASLAMTERPCTVCRHLPPHLRGALKRRKLKIEFLEGHMTWRYAVVLAVGALAAPTAKANDTWFCAITTEGKSQIIKYTVGKNVVTVTEGRARLFEKYFGPEFIPNSMKVLEDNAKGLIAVAAGQGTEPGEWSNYSSRMLIINKQTGALSDTELSTNTSIIKFAAANFRQGSPHAWRQDQWEAIRGKAAGITYKKAWVSPAAFNASYVGEVSD